jgi:hypothetical protein
VREIELEREGKFFYKRHCKERHVDSSSEEDERDWLLREEDCHFSD